MKRTLCAGAIALAAIGTLPIFSPASATEFGYGNSEQTQPPVVVNIERIRNVLQLTPEQERYWGPVEAALRNVARHQTQQESPGFVHRISHRVVSLVLDSVAVERLAVAARPLIAVLSDDQKRAATGLAQEMGLGPVVAALN
jgi:hypothetical protein